MNEKPFYKSKKYWAAATGAILPIALKRFGLELSEAELTMVISPIVAYIIGQGVADLGKNSNTVTEPIATSSAHTIGE